MTKKDIFTHSDLPVGTPVRWKLIFLPVWCNYLSTCKNPWDTSDLSLLPEVNELWVLVFPDHSQHCGIKSDDAIYVLVHAAYPYYQLYWTSVQGRSTFIWMAWQFCVLCHDCACIILDLWSTDGYSGQACQICQVPAWPQAAFYLGNSWQRGSNGIVLGFYSIHCIDIFFVDSLWSMVIQTDPHPPCKPFQCYSNCLPWFKGGRRASRCTLDECNCGELIISFVAQILIMLTIGQMCT